MVAIAFARTSTCLEKILQITAQHFELRDLPDPQLALPHGEFRDPLPFRWVDTPKPSLFTRCPLSVTCYPLPRERCAAGL